MRKSSCVILVAVAALLLQPTWAASSPGDHLPGELTGKVLDREGNPLANLVVFLVSETANHLPILTRTDPSGRLSFKNLKVGRYQLAVKSAFYQSPLDRLIDIEPGQTASIKLVLEQMLGWGGENRNVGLKTLLRSSNGRRLIFRTTPSVGIEDSDRSFFENATVEFYTNTALGANQFLTPGDVPAGTTTSFALKDAIGGNDYVVAGQINSGSDSSWRIKNILDYTLSDRHTLRMFMGYTRLGFAQAGPALVDTALEDGSRTFAPAKVFSVGFEDRIRWGRALSLTFGSEVNQVRQTRSEYYFSPSVELELIPLRGTSFRLLMSSKRYSQSNTVVLPGYGPINLSDAVFFSFLGESPTVGQARFYEASFAQQLGPDTRLELAAHHNLQHGGSLPFLSFMEGERNPKTHRLSEEEAWTRGYRATVQRHFGANVKGTVSYIHSSAVGLGGSQAVLIDREALHTFFKRRGYHALATQLDAFIPASRTLITALVKTVDKGNPLMSLDGRSNVFNTANQGLNIFVRQTVPVPVSLLAILGLDFLADYKFEALLEVRNLTNEDLGLLQSEQGDLKLLLHPRSVRGGITVAF